MKKFDKLECMIWVMALLPLIFTAAVYRRLPAEIPTHWGVNGEIDVYSAKSMAWLFPAMSLGIAALMKWMPAIDPRRENYKKFGKPYKALRLVLSLFFMMMCASTLYAAFEPAALPMDRIVTICAGVLICAMGNYMPKFRHNYFCGIRTPWTLANEEVWTRTHRMAGPIWFACGLAIAAAGIFIPTSGLLMHVVLGGAFLSGLAPCVYSYILYKKTKTPPKD